MICVQEQMSPLAGAKVHLIQKITTEEQQSDNHSARWTFCGIIPNFHLSLCFEFESDR